MNLSPNQVSVISFCAMLFFMVSLMVSLLATDASAGAPYCDPRVNWSCYQKWCSEQYGRTGKVYNDSRGVGCESRGGSSTGSSSYGGVSDNPFINALPGLLGEFMKGFERGMEQNRQRQLQREQELELQKLEEERRAEEAKKLEEKRRKEWEESKQKMLGEMRGLSDSELKPRDLSGLPELKVRETQGAFGTKELKPRDLSAPGQTTYGGSGYGATIKRASCSAYLLKKAEAAAAAGKFEESAYLSNEAADFMSGAKDFPEVVCPPPPDVPAVQGAPIKESLEEAEKLEKMTVLYSRLYSRVSQQMADYNVVVEGVKKAEDKVKETETGVTEAETKKKELEVQKQEDPQSIPDSAMAEALAALNRAKEALAESQKELKGLNETKADMEKDMEKTKDLFIQAQKQPENADDMLKRLDAGQGKGEN